MAQATLERAGNTVTLELVETGGTPVASRDIGKPTLNYQNTGAINPRFNDFASANLTYTLTGRFISSSAYSDAIELVDLIKDHSGGTPITLNVDMPEFDTDVSVMPSAGNDSACSVTYEPGRKTDVKANLSLSRVATVNSGANQAAQTPTTSGSGPIQIRGPSNTVDLETNVAVNRTVGRPESVVRRNPAGNFPNYYDKAKSATDRIELSLEFVENAETKVNQLKDMFVQQLGRTALTLDFQGVYGMGEFDVVPDGSRALRNVRPAGEEGTNIIPVIGLRRVLNG